MRPERWRASPSNGKGGLFPFSPLKKRRETVGDRSESGTNPGGEWPVDPR